MATWQNYPGGSYYPGQQGYPGYSGGPAYPGGPVYPGAPAYPTAPAYPQAGYPGFPQQPGFAPHGYMQSQPAAYLKYSVDPLQDRVDGFNFDSISIRQAFVRKVYLILMIQLLITFLFAAYFTYNENAKFFAQRNMPLAYVCMIATFVLMIVMACCEDTRRRAPLNFILLAIFTFAESVIVGFIASVNKENHVLIAVGITAVICFALTLFAFQTTFDFTGLGIYLFIAAVVLMIFGFVTMFFHSNTSVLIYSTLGALLFSFYLVYDTQLMLGGKHKYALSPEEYIFAALNLYLDIVYIFLNILNILNISSRD